MVNPFDELRRIQSSIAKERDSINRSVGKESSNLNKSIARQHKAIQKSIAKDSRVSISKEGRIPIPAKRRHEVENKYHNRCAEGCSKVSGVKLQIHHKNMKNNDNRLSNLELLCPNHHIQRHSKYFRKKYVKRDVFGVKSVRTRLVSKKRNKELRKKKARQERKASSSGSFGGFDMSKELRWGN